MNRPIRNLLAGGALCATLLGTGGAVAYAQSGSTSTTEPAASSDQRPPDAPGCGADPAAHEADMAADLAAKLGLAADQVTAAQQAAHGAVDAQLGAPSKPTSPPATDEERQAMKDAMTARHDLADQTMADQLGITVDELTSARLAVLEDHLGADVSSGKITQEQADARLSAAQNGEFGPGGPGGHGGPGPR